MTTVLLGACNNEEERPEAVEQTEQEQENEVDHEALNEPQDLIGDGERVLGSEYVEEDFRLYLNSEEHDLEYSSTLSFVVENESDEDLILSASVSLSQLVDGDYSHLDEVALDESYVVQENSSDKISVDLNQWDVEPDTGYRINIDVVDYDEDVHLEFYTGLIDEINGNVTE